MRTAAVLALVSVLTLAACAAAQTQTTPSNPIVNVSVDAVKNLANAEPDSLKIDADNKQPILWKLDKDAVVRFTGTLTGYTQNPFMLTWEKAKINAEDLPEEKGPAKKAPAKKAPAKKAPSGN